MNSLINPQLAAMAKQAVANVTALTAAPTDSILASKRAFVPGGDPAMDPAAAGGGGGDPAAAGGAAPPPAPPPAPAPAMPMGGQQMVEPIKPKIDVNVEMMQIKKMLARIADALGVQIPASEMAVTSQDLTQSAMGQQQQPQQPPSAIPPIQPMGAAAPGMGGGGKQGSANGHYDPNTLGTLSERASALARIKRSRAETVRDN